jgi:ABC-type multidrug transport system fused ATPase/permease subunit
MLTYVIVGGLGSVFGGAVGAAVVGWLQHWIRESFQSGFGAGASYYPIVTNGLLLIGFVLLFREGILARANVDRLRNAIARVRPDGRISATADDGAPEGPPVPVTTPTASAGNGRTGSPRHRPTVVCSGLSRSFGSIRAVNGVDVTLEPGTIIAMVGPNGACRRPARSASTVSGSTGCRRPTSPASA